MGVWGLPLNTDRNFLKTPFPFCLSCESETLPSTGVAGEAPAAGGFAGAGSAWLFPPWIISVRILEIPEGWSPLFSTMPGAPVPALATVGSVPSMNTSLRVEVDPAEATRFVLVSIAAVTTPGGVANC